MSQQEHNAIYAMGPEGSYSHAATAWVANRIHYGRGTTTKVHFTRSIADAIHVANERIEFAVIPVENTVSGLVLDGILALRNLEKRNIFYKGDFWLPVEHKVLGRKGLGEQWGARAVLAHPHAAAQCAQYLAQQSLPVMPAMSTAEAARLVATDDAYVRCLAIASGEAAKAYGLTVYQENVADKKENATRFQLYGPELARMRGAEEKSVICVSLHNRPDAIGELGTAIGCEGVGINALHALPTGSKYAYDFYVEFASRISSERGRRIWSSLKDISTKLTLLGEAQGE